MLDHIIKENPSPSSHWAAALYSATKTVKRLKKGHVVVLLAVLSPLLSRLTADEYVRPLIKADPRQRLTDLLARREAHYASFGEPILTDGLSPDEIASQLQIRLGRS